MLERLRGIERRKRDYESGRSFKKGDRDRLNASSKQDLNEIVVKGVGEGR